MRRSGESFDTPALDPARRTNPGARLLGLEVECSPRGESLTRRDRIDESIPFVLDKFYGCLPLAARPMVSNALYTRLHGGSTLLRHRPSS